MEFPSTLSAIFVDPNVSNEDRLDEFYFPYQKQTAYNCRIYAGGSLYNHYKYLRKIFNQIESYTRK